jgi:hypothetical protein
MVPAAAGEEGAAAPPEAGARVEAIRERMNATLSSVGPEATPDLLSCIERSIDTCQGQVIRTVAYGRKDESLCAAIVNPAARDTCRDGLLATKAVQAGDASLCVKIGSAGDRDTCIVRVVAAKAQQTGDASGCAGLQEAVLKDQCTEQVLTQVAQTKREAAGCDALKGDARSRCRAQVLPYEAVEDEDPGRCRELETPERIEACTDSASQMLASRTADASWCDRMRNAARRSQCSDAVTVQLARQKGDPALCGQVKDPRVADNCRATARPRPVADRP